MSLACCATCDRHHDPATPCPFCANAGGQLPLQLGGALLLGAAATLGCVGPATTTPAARPALTTEGRSVQLIDTLPTPTPGPTPTPVPETTYGMPAPRRRRIR